MACIYPRNLTRKARQSKQKSDRKHERERTVSIRPSRGGAEFGILQNGVQTTCDPRPRIIMFARPVGLPRALTYRRADRGPQDR
eukprot:3093-Prymnesium_polylepis.2